MTTEISGVGLTYSGVSQAGSVAVQQVSESARVGVLPAEVESSDKPGASTNQVASAFARLRVRQDALNEAASVVREVDNTVERAGRLLDRMEEGLVAVVKMYPPYPIDSPERVSMLNSLGGLRKQIEALTYPPQPTLDTVERSIAGREDASSAAQAVSAGKDAVSAARVAMWDIPALDPAAASDEALIKALDQVQAMRSDLKDVRVRMWQDVVDYVRQADSPEAQQQGAATREQLADLGDRSIGTSGHLLQQAAESK